MTNNLVNGIDNGPYGPQLHQYKDSKLQDHALCRVRDTNIVTTITRGAGRTIVHARAFVPLRIGPARWVALCELLFVFLLVFASFASFARDFARERICG
jgi:hypothetical protein